MQLRYGSLSFDVDSCETTLNIDTLTNQRGVPYCQVHQMNVSGYLAGADTATVSALCDTLEAALANPYRDLVLYSDAGPATHMAMYNVGSTTGVIITGPRYPVGKGAELVTMRKFEFTARAEYPIGTGQNVLQMFRETVTVIGDGGPRFIMKPALIGPPQKQITQEQTVVRASQSGQAIGYLDYPTPPPPLWPQSEHREQRQITRSGGIFRGKVWQDFGVQWVYQFEGVGALSGKPNLR